MVSRLRLLEEEDEDELKNDLSGGQLLLVGQRLISPRSIGRDGPDLAGRYSLVVLLPPTSLPLCQSDEPDPVGCLVNTSPSPSPSGSM